MGYGIGRRRDSDLMLLWLWCRSVATAPIRPLAWELLCATGVALKSKKKKRWYKRKMNFFVVVVHVTELQDV